VEQVLLHCAAARHKHLTNNGRPRGLQQLFKNPARTLDVLRFLEETGACAKPRAEWEDISQRETRPFWAYAIHGEHAHSKPPHHPWPAFGWPADPFLTCLSIRCN
jgi:hypothetical protein